jgi:hypothetical protein
MDLSEKAKNNLSVILSLTKDDTLTANRGTLSKQDEFVQIDNVQELEYAIYFTFHQLLLSFENKKTNNRLLFIRMDEAINSLYENKQVNQFMESDEHFCEIIEDTDNYISYLEDKHLFRSPLYKCNKTFYPILKNVYLYFEKMRDFSKLIFEAVDELTFGDLSDFEDDDNSDDDNSDDNNIDDNNIDDGNVLKNQECDEVFNIEDEEDDDKSKIE